MQQEIVITNKASNHALRDCTQGKRYTIKHTTPEGASDPDGFTAIELSISFIDDVGDLVTAHYGWGIEYAE